MPTDSVVHQLAIRVSNRLRDERLMLVTAESCTGGMVATAITDISGSSGWFERGFVTYSNAAKEEMLGVRPQTLARHGAVSEETAREMALGALAHSRADVALAITGVAGPSGGSAEKPVGTVCFAWATKGAAARSETRRFAGDREAVRRQSVERAFHGVLELLDAG
jgi:nicotinamide-nucleotide amidase